MIKNESVTSYSWWDSGGQQGRLGQQFSLSRPRTCADEYIKSAVPAVPHQSFNVRLKAEISFVSL